MQAQIKNKGIRAEAVITKLYVPHLDSEITFIHPAKEPDTYVNLAEQLKKDNLSQPTMSHNTSLIHAAWQNPKEKYSKEIINILRDNWLRCFNGILYEPNEGAYIQDTPEIRNNRLIMNKLDLIKRLESNDSSVRFVPFGYKIGELSSYKDLENHPLVIGLAGEEGAQKLAEASTNFKYRPYVWGFDSVDEPLIRVASLGGVLGVYGNGWVGDLDYAFGVFNETGEASSQKF